MRDSPIASEDWNKNHYQAGAMKLAVVGLCLSLAETAFEIKDLIPKGDGMRGQQPLEELEKMALSRFSRVRLGKGQAETKIHTEPLGARMCSDVPGAGGAELSHFAVAKGSSGPTAQS